VVYFILLIIDTHNPIQDSIVIVLSEISEHIGKMFVIFILGVLVIAIGMTIQLIAIVLLGGLLSGVSALIMLLGVL